MTAATRPHAADGDASRERSHLRVLVVDDDVEDAWLTQNALAEIPRFTCSMDCANSYTDALQALQRATYDVIVLDDGLGVRSGLELLEEAFGATLPVAVVLLTGVASHDVDEAASRAGIAHVLEKSEVRAGPLERSVRSALERARIEREVRGARAFFRAAFDAMPDHVAILDELGGIVDVNRPWEEFARGNPCFERPRPGDNYPAKCDASAREGSAHAAEMATGLRAMLAGTRDSFAMLYPCGDEWFNLSANRVRIDGAQRFMVTHHEVTGQRHTERALRDSAERYRSLFDANPTPLWVSDDATSAILSANDAAIAHYGYSLEEFLALTAYDMRVPEERAHIDKFIADPGVGLSSTARGRHRKKNGDIIDVEVVLHSMEYDGRPCHMVLSTDVTERTRADRAQAAALEVADLARRRLEATLEIMPVGVFIMDANGGTTHANEAAQKIWKGTLPTVTSRDDYHQFRAWFVASGKQLQPEDWPTSVAQRTGEAVEAQALQIARMDGSRGHVLISAVPIRDADGRVSGTVAVNVDISDQYEKEEELASLIQSLEFERNKLSGIFAQAPAFMGVMRGPHHVFEMANEQCVRLMGRDPTGRPGADALPELAEQGLFAIADRVLATGEPYFGTHMPATLRPAPGVERLRFINVAFQPLQEADGSISGVLMHGVDVTTEVASANSLRDSEEQYRSLVELSPDGIIIHVDGAIVFANSAAARILHAASPADLLGYETEKLPHSEALALARERLSLVMAGGSAPQISTRWLTLDGEVRQIDVASVELDFGGRSAVHTVFRDTTEHHELEEQLRQSQKMEAVGQLAGGVAHDFNNLLTVIKANVEFLLEDLDAGDPRRAEVMDVRDAADRAATLTRQLLAFSRKQILQPRVLSCNAVVTRVKPMLDRLIREDIAFQMRLTEHVGSIVADVGQLEQVLLNLVVNARDAMPSGGRLLIGTSEVTLAVDERMENGCVAIAGKYAAISVSDTGTGIAEAVRSRIFEPFFTTKAVGEGTGLGLSTVYGVVNQSGGYLRVASVTGQGTTFTVFLPVVAGRPAQTGESPSLAAVPGTETILVVEDMDSLREIARRVLERRGYTVLAARDGTSALAMAARHDGPIDLVLTDVVMPEMNGVQLVALLKAERPDVSVLYMSGYADDDGARRGIESASAVFLPKPFSPAQLLLFIRVALTG